MNASQFQGPAPFEAVINEAAKLRALREQSAELIGQQRHEQLLKDVESIKEAGLDGRKNRFPWAKLSEQIRVFIKQGKKYDWILDWAHNLCGVDMDYYTFVTSVNKRGLNK